MVDSLEKDDVKKFLFDLNIFDDDYVEEPEEPEEPPPPVFSEEELEVARKEGYERGVKEATDREKGSREQFIAGQIEMLAQNFPKIFEAEKERERRFEEDALHLALCMLRKLFPLYNERFGFGEVLDVVSETLSSYEKTSVVKIEVSPDISEDLGKHLAGIISQYGEERVEIVSAEDVVVGNCRVSWKDGGAVRNVTALAREIEESIEKLLAARGVKPDYSDDKVVDSSGEQVSRKESVSKNEAVSDEVQDDGEVNE